MRYIVTVAVEINEGEFVDADSASEAHIAIAIALEQMTRAGLAHYSNSETMTVTAVEAEREPLSHGVRFGQPALPTA